MRLSRRALRLSLAIGGGVVAMALLLAWLMGAFHHKVAPAPPVAVLPLAPAGAATLTVQAVTVPVTESAVGTVQPVQRVTMASRLLARVTAMHVERAGSACRAGELLVELDDTDLRARHEEAKAAHDAAVAAFEQTVTDLARAEELFAGGALSQEALDQARTGHRTAQAREALAAGAVEAAATTLGFARLHAPFDGVVIDKQVEAGDMVSPGQALVTVYDPTRMQLIARVREQLALTLAAGDGVEVEIPSLDQRCRGTVDQIVPEASGPSRIFDVKVVGPCPPGVLVGMFGRMHLPRGTRTEIRIPAAAVRTVGQVATVSVVQADRRVLRRFVETGATTGRDVEILTGLAPGEVILATPQ